jgi:hypothetical protein
VNSEIYWRNTFAGEPSIEFVELEKVIQKLQTLFDFLLDRRLFAVATIDNCDGASSGSHSAAITIANTATVTETVPATLSGNENTAISLAGISVSDTTNTGDSGTTTLTVSHGTITVGTPGGIGALLLHGGPR